VCVSSALQTCRPYLTRHQMFRQRRLNVEVTSCSSLMVCNATGSSCRPEAETVTWGERIDPQECALVLPPEPPTPGYRQDSASSQSNSVVSIYNLSSLDCQVHHLHTISQHTTLVARLDCSGVLGRSIQLYQQSPCHQSGELND
jgi:hypothetical protein